MSKALFKHLQELDDIDAVWETPADADADVDAYDPNHPKSGIVTRTRDSIPVDFEEPEAETNPNNGGTVIPRLYDSIPGEESTGATRLSETANQIGRMSKLAAVPRVVWPDVSNLPLDPSTAFLFSRIDGVSNLETLLDLCAMPEAEAMAALLRLVELGVIVFE